MQKRRVRTSQDMQLPVTMSDLSKKNKSLPRSGRKSRHTNGRGTGSSTSTLVTCGLFLLVVVLVGFLLTSKFDFISHFPSSLSSSSSSATVTDSFGTAQVKSSSTTLVKHSLSKFHSIDRALAESKLVGLYFAASWCSMSTPVSDNLETIFSANSLQNRLLLSEKQSRTGGSSLSSSSVQKDLALVYVSSDRSEQDMEKYSRSNWIDVPYGSPDRNNLKRHFRTCAEVEMEDLGIEVRRFIIPTLIIVDSQTHGILSTNGVDDLKEYGADVLDHWLQLQALTRGLEDKYEEQ